MRTPQSAQSLPSGQLVASVGGVIELGPPSPQMASFARFNPAESAHVLVQTPPGTSGGDVGGDGGMMRGPQSAQSEPSGQLVASVRGVIELGPPSPQIASLARFIEVESAHVLVQIMEPGAIGGAGGGESAAAPGAVRRRPALSPSSSLLSRHFTPCSESCLLRSSSAP